MKKIYRLFLVFSLGSLLSGVSISFGQNLNSATDSVIVTSTNSVTDWGRGFRFEPTQDMWVIKLGKRVPANGSYSWVIWDVATQTKVLQQTSLLNSPGNYIYEDADSIVKLNSGSQYILELYGAGTAQYYYGNSSQIGQDLIYYDMKYCNNCNNNDYPTNTLTNIHYGTPDFLYSLSYDCSGTPTAGATQAAAVQINCDTTTMLSLSGNTIGNGITYQWQYNNGNGWVNFGTDTNTLSTPSITTSTQFHCIITCTKPGGGNATSTPVSVTILPLPVALGNDTTLCPGVTQVLNAGNPGSTYLWNTSATTQSVNISLPGTYSVQVTNPSGCSGSDTIAITQGIQPVNVLPANTDLCAGDTIALDAGNAGSAYHWSTGASSQAISTATGGNYSVVITSPDGCQLTSATDVTLRALPIVDLGPDTSICPNASIILDAGNAGAQYLWNTNAVTQTIPTTDSGNYSVLVTNAYNCVSSGIKHIAFLTLAETDGFDFIPLFDEDLGKVKFAPINPVDVTTYQWDFGDGSPVSNAENPTHTFTQSGEYHVVLKVSNGCGQTETALNIHVDLTTGIVSVDKEDNSAIKLYPNPARELLNIENKSTLDLLSVSVFNTLGRLVYQKTFHTGDPRAMNVSGLANGIYSVRILTNKGWLVKRFEIVR